MKNHLKIYGSSYHNNLVIMLVILLTSILTRIECLGMTLSYAKYLPSRHSTPYSKMLIKASEEEHTPFGCPCKSLNNIGSPFTTTLWSSLTLAQKTAPCFTIEGELYIDQAYAFGAVEMRMGESAMITIGTGLTISFTGTHFYACDKMWNGIKLASVTAGLWIHGCLIEDAIIAIDNNNFDRPSLIYNNTFNNNYIGIKQAYPTIATTTSFITDNTFTSTGLKDHPILNAMGQLGYCGILCNYADAEIGVPTSTTYNTFNNLAIGISAINSYLTVYKNVFQNIPVTPFYSGATGVGILSQGPVDSYLNVGGNPGIPISYSQFSNVSDGIATVDGRNYIKHTTMVNVNSGITALITKSGINVIDSNIITTKSKGIDVIEISSSDIGEFKIYDNFIYDHFLAGVVTWHGIKINMLGSSSLSTKLIGGNLIDATTNITYGVYINNIQNAYTDMNAVRALKRNFTGLCVLQYDRGYIANNGVYCPTSGNTSVGYSINQLNNAHFACNLANETETGVLINSPNTNVEMITNSMDDNPGRGLMMQNSSTFTSSSGAQSLNGNLWVSPGSTPAEHLGTTAQITGSLFRPNSPTLPYFAVGYNAPAEVSPNLWFKTISGTDQTSDCSLLDPDTNPPGFTNLSLEGRNNSPNATDWLEMYINDSMTYNLYSEELQSMSNQLVFDYMTANPSLDYNQNLSNFYNEYINTPSGKINILYNQRSKTLDYTNQMNQIEELNNQLLDLYTDRNAHYSQLSATPTWSEFIEYEDQVFSINEEISILKTDIINVVQSIEGLFIAKAQNLLNDLNNIENPDEVQALLQKQVLQISLNLDLANYAISNSDLNELRSIADKCPAQGGRAVSWARTLVTFYDHDAYWEDNHCDSPISNLIEDENQKAINYINDEFEGFPNPSNGTIHLIAPKNFVGRVNIQNSLGDVMYDDVHVHNKEIELDNASGLYIITWFDENGIKIMNKKQIFIK